MADKSQANIEGEYIFFDIDLLKEILIREITKRMWFRFFQTEKTTKKIIEDAFEESRIRTIVNG